MSDSSLEIEYELRVEFDDMPVRGNALASGDPKLDKEVEDEILDRLDKGDVWAWACVRVIAKFKDMDRPVGVAHLGGCSYKDEEDFKQGGYFEDMKGEALQDLLKKLRKNVEFSEECRIRLNEYLNK